jgi:aldehyde dehydrogenase (NAD+)
MGKLFEEAGLPAGVFNVVTGDNNVVGDYITSHPIPKMISFTGSTAVGKHIGKIAGEKLKKVALELGGSAPFVVLDDANVDNAVDSAIFGKFIHQGQICMSTNRIIVHESLIKEFTQKFVGRAKKLTYGDPKDKSTVIGPLIDRKSVEKVLKVIADSVAMGAKVETGNIADGNVLQPTILSGITIEMPIFNKEIFGPAVGIISFKTVDEAITLANDTEYGLSGAVHGGDIYKAMEVARRINTGMIHVNDQSVNDEPHLPFGGEKNSGLGRFGGNFILEEMTTVQLVTIQKEKRVYPF